MLLLCTFANNTFAQCVPDFGNASHFALFSVAGAVGNTGTSTINGDIGTNTGAITGFRTPTLLNGTIYTPNTHTSNAATDLIAAYNELFNTTETNASHAPAFGSGETITAGVYAIGGAGSIAGNLILDGEGNSESVFIFKFGGAFTTGASSNVILTNGATAANIFWIAEGAIAMATYTTMHGTLIANNDAASMGNQGILHGRLYSTTGAVSIYGTNVDVTGIVSNPIGGTVASDQSICSGTSPADLVVTGISGEVLKWQSATEATFANPIDIASNSTTLSGSTIGNLTTTTYFRAVVQKIGCVDNTAYSSQCTITIASTTWDGSSWSNGDATVFKSVIFTGNFTTTENLLACTMQVTNNAQITVLSGHSVILNGALHVETGASFKLKNGANLIQSTNDQNVGVITVEKTTAPLIRLDYVLWSSSVENQMLLAFSPLTLTNRFYSYSPTLDQFVPVPFPATSPFLAGSARLIRMPFNHPTAPQAWNGSFIGKPNNGTVSLTVSPNTYNAIGNPYPSGINADSFMQQNNITEALYFWRKTNNNTSSSYAVYTTAGGTSNSSGDPLNLVPGSIIPVGQGFIAKSTSNQFIFNNSMRLAAVNVPLLRTLDDKSRIWLDITTTNGFFGQLLVAYMPNATLGVDNAIDGRFFNDSPTALTSMINNEQFSIQGRPSFEATDVVALGFKSELVTTYTISINHLDGIFLTNQTIFLRDNLLGILHNIKVGAYTFTSQAGVYNSRFELVYQNVLNANQFSFNSDQVVIYKQNSNLIINSGQTVMENVKVYDVLGRLLTENTAIDSSSTQIKLNEANQVLIVKITSDKKEVVTKKVIH